jgi:hypothetical protein
MTVFLVSGCLPDRAIGGIWYGLVLRGSYGFEYSLNQEQPKYIRGVLTILVIYHYCNELYHCNFVSVILRS